MPGIGKSTVGKDLALKLKYKFIDTDVLIEQKYGEKLADILVDVGENKFIKIEGEAIESLGEISNCVISPGGSVIYSPAAMKLLKEKSVLFFLDAEPELSAERIDLDLRGIVHLAGKSYRDLYNERKPLYLECADYKLSTGNLVVLEIVDQILKLLN